MMLLKRRHHGELLDEVVVAALENLDGDMLADVVPMYCEQAGAHIFELACAAGRGETLTVARTAHKLKGSSVTLGAALVAEIASELEATAQAGDLSVADQLLERLRTALDETREAFRTRAATQRQTGSTMHAEATSPDGNTDLRPSLLIADDDAVMRVTLSNQLKGDFRIVAIASNGTEAIELAQKHRPDAALIDVQMPHGGARQVVPQIAAHSPETRMVILSSDESRESVMELIGAGATAYLRKGRTGEQICKTLNDAVQLGRSAA
jgi:CheY-like chemotaxis protein/HPt (histidine-containing phosphotransfer) domain-containing protein